MWCKQKCCILKLVFLLFCGYFMFSERTVAFLVSVIEAVAGLKMMARKQTMSSQDDQMFSWPVILAGQVHGFKIHVNNWEKIYSRHICKSQKQLNGEVFELLLVMNSENPDETPSDSLVLQLFERQLTVYNCLFSAFWPVRKEPWLNSNLFGQSSCPAIDQKLFWALSCKMLRKPCTFSLQWTTSQEKLYQAARH